MDSQHIEFANQYQRMYVRQGARAGWSQLLHSIHFTGLSRLATLWREENGKGNVKAFDAKATVLLPKYKIVPT